MRARICEPRRGGCERPLSGADPEDKCRGLTVYTIGHSNRGLGELVGVLKRYGVRLVVDVRRRPGSSCCPWFNKSVLEKELPRRGLGYYWLGDLLGGIDVSYPEYMYSSGFRRGIAILLELAWACNPIVVMCREKYWMRCHRAFIADVLHSIGVRVIHIVDLGVQEKHVPLKTAPEKYSSWRMAVC